MPNQQFRCDSDEGKLLDDITKKSWEELILFRVTLNSGIINGCTSAEAWSNEVVVTEPSNVLGQVLDDLAMQFAQYKTFGFHYVGYINLPAPVSH